MTGPATAHVRAVDAREAGALSPAEPVNVLVVDDDDGMLELLRRILEHAGYRCLAARSAAEARTVLARTPVPLVLCDVSMPGESGIQLVSSLPASPPHTAVVMVSGHDDAQVVQTSLENGAFGYLTKPFKPNDILIGVAGALRRRQLELDSRAREDRLEQLVRLRNAALESSAAQLKHTRQEIIRRLSVAVESRHGETAAHVERMSRYAAVLSRRFDLDPEVVRLASSLHDVGKVAVSDGILLKPGPLTGPERRAMERHAEVGHRILAGSDSGLLELAATVAWTHHERVDGSGYPRGLSGSAIPLAGRIAAVADVFDALTSDRPYRAALSVGEALAMMRKDRGRHFDACVLDVLFDCLDEILELRELWSDDAFAGGGAPL